MKDFWNKVKRNVYLILSIGMTIITIGAIAHAAYSYIEMPNNLPVFVYVLYWILQILILTIASIGVANIWMLWLETKNE